MTRGALTKLFILVILAFIICLPEFFSLYRVSKVNFLCQPYQPCAGGNQVKKGEFGNNGDAEINRKDMCDPSQTPEYEKWKQACIQHNQSSRTGSALNSSSSGEYPDGSWFVCQTDKDMAVLHSNISSSALQEYLEVSVEFQLDSARTLNLTLYGRRNYSSLHLDFPEEEEEKEPKTESFYCCLPGLLTSESTNQSQCLLWLANQTIWTAKETVPWKQTQKGEWRCTFRVIWLALLCMVLLTIVTTVIGQIYWQKYSCKKPKVRPVHYNITGHQIKDGEKQTVITAQGTIPHRLCESTFWSALQPTGLSPIPECEIQEDIETLLEGSVENSYTAKLHHRVHPSTSSLIEEQVW